MLNTEKRIDASGIVAVALAGFLLAVGIIQGAADEGAHIMRGHEDRLAIATAATRAGVHISPADLLRMR